MAYKEQIMVNQLPQVQEQMPSSNGTYSDYRNMPMEQVYNANRIKDTSEYRTFINFLKYKEALDMTELMEKQGVITINRPDVIEYEEEEVSTKEVVIVLGVIFAIIKIGLMIV